MRIQLTLASAFVYAISTLAFGENILFDITDAGTVLKQEVNPAPPHTAMLEHYQNGERRFEISGAAGARARWFIPVHSTVFSACDIKFDIGSDNIDPVHGKANLSLSLLSKNVDANDGDNASKTIPVYSAAGTRDHAFGSVPLDMTAAEWTIDGFYVDIELAAEGVGFFLVTDLQVTFSGNLPADSETTRVLETPPDAEARIMWSENGSAAIAVGDNVIDGLVFDARALATADYPDCGVGVVRVPLNFGVDSGDFAGRSLWRYPDYIDFHGLRDTVRAAVGEKNNYIILDVLLGQPPSWWASSLAEDPAEADLSAFATPGAAKARGKSSVDDTVANISDSDPRWKDYRRRCVRYALAFCRQQDYADRIVGCAVVAGIGHNRRPYPGREQSTYYAQSFRRWLEARYGSVQRLRSAWRDEAVDFAAAVPLPPSGWGAGTIGGFAHPLIRRQAADSRLFYYESWSQTLVDLAGLVKEAGHGRLLAGVVGGPVNQFHPLWNDHFRGGGEPLRMILESDWVDFVEIPLDDVDLRNGAGGSGVEQVIGDLLRRHHKLPLVRNDISFSPRDHLLQQAIRDAADIAPIHRRIFVSNLLNNHQLQIAGDVSDRQDGAACADLKLFAEIVRKSRKVRMRRSPECAFVVDPDTFSHFLPGRHSARDRSNRGVLAYSPDRRGGYDDDNGSAYFYTIALPRLVWHRLGAAFDVVSIDDIEPDRYKTIVFHHVNYLDSRRLDAIDRCRDAARWLVFSWATGFTSDRYLSARGVSRASGITVKMINKSSRMQLTATPAMGTFLNRRVDASPLGWLYAYRDPYYCGNVQTFPTFVVDDATATELAAYADGDGAAVAVKEFSDWTSVYSGSPVVNPEVLRTVLKNSGCHVFLETSDQCFINDSFIAIHTLPHDGVREVILPGEEPLYEVFRRQSLAAAERHHLELEGGRTYLFFRGSEARWSAL